MALKPGRLLPTLLVIGAFMWVTSAYAADVIILMSPEIPLFKEAEQGFRSRVGGNVTTFIMDREADPENKKLLRKMRNENMGLLLVIGSQAMQVAVKEFTQVPIVFCFVLDYTSIISPVNAKGNIEISGVTMTIPPEQQIRMLLEINPQIKRLGIVYDKSKSGALVEEVRKATRLLGITLVAREIDSQEAAVNAISALQGEIDAYLMLPDSTVLTPESVKYLLLFSFKNQIALVGLSEKYVKQGALLSLSFDSKEIGRQAGELANDYLMGTPMGAQIGIKNSTGRIVDPRTLRLSINKNTAEQVNIKVPDQVLKKAHQIY